MTLSTVIIGRRYWILIWYGILALGIAGMFGAIYWARRTGWRNRDEFFRALGTTVVSVGMLLLLNGVAEIVGQALLVLALVLFILAFVLGRRPDALSVRRNPGDDETDEEGPRP